MWLFNQNGYFSPHSTRWEAPGGKNIAYFCSSLYLKHRVYLVGLKRIRYQKIFQNLRYGSFLMEQAKKELQIFL